MDQLRTPQVYNVPLLAEQLHSVPRWDFSLHRVNATFRPHSVEYKESLIIWTAAPTALLLITLLIFLIYFCYQCCKRTASKKRHMSCVRWSTAVITVISCVAIGVGFYANREAEKGLDNATGAISSAGKTVGRIQTQIQQLQNTINQTVLQHLSSLTAATGLPDSLNTTGLESFLQSVHDYVAGLPLLITEIEHFVHIEEIANWTQHSHSIEKFCHYRWLALTLLLVVLLLLCFMLFIGIARSSKCALLLFSVFGALCLVVCWIFAGIHLGIGLASSDICVDPRTVFNQQSNPAYSEILDYYLTCDSNMAGSQFVENATTELKTATGYANSVIRDAKKNGSDQQLIDAVVTILRGLDDARMLLMVVTALMDCNSLHRDYVNGLNGLCHKALPGVALMTLSLATVAFLFTLLIILATVSVQHIRGRQKRQLHSVMVSVGDDDNVFLPSIGDRSCSLRHTDQQPNMPLIAHRTTPPPAYTSEGFYRQYSDFSPSEDSHYEYRMCEAST
jgi:succinate dehydrogenase hydrophobic anchor subunit